MRIAIIGIDAKQNLLLANEVQKFMQYPVISSPEDEMLDLLKLDSKKYFNAYQLHLLLDRCEKIEKNQDAILCDSLFTDICSVKAALQLNIVSPLEADVYFSKHNEYNDFLMQCDHILYIDSKNSFLENMVNMDDKFKGDFSLKYYLECYELYFEKIVALRGKLKDKFIDISLEYAEEMLHSLFGKTKETTLENVSKESSPIYEQDIVIKPELEKSSKDLFFAEMEAKDLQITILSCKEEVQSLISDFEEGINLEHTAYASVDEDNIICLKQIFIEGEPTINCKIFHNVADAIAFMR